VSRHTEHETDLLLYSETVASWFATLVLATLPSVGAIPQSPTVLL